MAPCTWWRRFKRDCGANPRWLGKTVLSRATAEGRCGFSGPDGTIGNCALALPGVPFFGLIDATGWTNGAAVAGSLPLLLDPPQADPPLLHALRWFRLLPQPRRQTLTWPQATSYRVHLRIQAPCFTEGHNTPCATGHIFGLDMGGVESRHPAGAPKWLAHWLPTTLKPSTGQLLMLSGG